MIMMTEMVTSTSTRITSTACEESNNIYIVISQLSHGAVVVLQSRKTYNIIVTKTKQAAETMINTFKLYFLTTYQEQQWKQR